MPESSSLPDAFFTCEISWGKKARFCFLFPSTSTATVPPSLWSPSSTKQTQKHNGLLIRQQQKWTGSWQIRYPFLKLRPCFEKTNHEKRKTKTQNKEQGWVEAAITGAEIAFFHKSCEDTSGRSAEENRADLWASKRTSSVSKGGVNGAWC